MTTSRTRSRVVLSHLPYLFVIHLACALALGLWSVRALRGREPWSWIAARLGRLPGPPPSGAPVWVHAVSVGEVKASRRLVAELRQRGLPVVLSTGTITGLETARRLYPGLYVFAWPLDLPWVVGPVLRRVAPRSLVTVELEVWPTMMRLADREGIPQAIVNGRVSEGSFRSYRRLSWWLPEFDRLALVAAQTEVYAHRLRALGVRPERVVVCGNLKHDLARAPDPAVCRQLARELALDPPPAEGGADEAGPSVEGASVEGAAGNAPPGPRLRGRLPVFLAGSTHDGEDEPVVRAWLAAGGARASTLLLVPRHPDRLPDIERLLRRAGVSFCLRSRLSGERDPEAAVLVDTLGELEALFGLADVVFLGGSLVPVGGHNVLEPAAAGRPVLVGPWLDACRAEADALRAAGGLEVVPDGEALASRLAALLADAPSRQAMGAAARRGLEGLAGATDTMVGQLGAWGILRDPPSAGGASPLGT